MQNGAVSLSESDRSAEHWTDASIRNLFFLPHHLKQLDFRHGHLTNINLSKLPRGLEWLHLTDNRIPEMVIESVPLALRFMFIGGNPLNQGITFKVPLPDGLRVYIPRNVYFVSENDEGVASWQDDLINVM